jgi:spermidine synthase
MTRPRFEELAWRATPIGEISLRRRVDPLLDVDVYEVKIDDEFLMSSLFTVAEEELSRLGLAATDGDDLDVVVGGLGLGYTARTALEDPRVRSLLVVEAVDEVIAWHERGLLPFAAPLTTDPRSRLIEADFFAMAASPEGFDPAVPGRRFDAILLDVDHSPRHVLAPANAALYTAGGLRGLARHLRDGGVFALWSDDPPDAGFEAALAEVFATTASHVVPFANPITGGESANTVYVATTGPGAAEPPR